MPRPKNQEKDLLKHLIRIRVNEALFCRLTKLQKESDCRSICEIVRKILANERINCFYKDTSLNGPMEELAMIRKELKAIGININQQTHFFHVSDSAVERAYYVNKTKELYQSVEVKVNVLLNLVERLAEKWLQKS